MTTTAILFDKDGTLFDFQATWSGWIAGMLRVLAQGDGVLEAVLAETEIWAVVAKYVKGQRMVQVAFDSGNHEPVDRP